MSNLKSTFNEKVFDLRQSKIKLINDYKQFKFDVNIIQNELNDPEVITPLDFPEVVVDESIDVRNMHCYNCLFEFYKIYTLQIFRKCILGISTKLQTP